MNLIFLLLLGSSRHREFQKEAMCINQIGDDGGLSEVVGSSGSGKKWTDDGCILRVLL